MTELKTRTEAADLATTTAADFTQISDYDEVAEVFRSRKFVQGSHVNARQSIMENTLIVLDGKPHLKRRNLLNQLFSENNVAELRARHLAPAVQQCMMEIAAMPKDRDGQVSTDLVPLVQRCVYRIAAAVTGIDGLEDAKTADRMISQIKTITAGFTVEWSREPQTKVMAEAIEAQEAFHKELFDASEQRRVDLMAMQRAGKLAKEDLPMDVLTLMLLRGGEEWEDDSDLRLRETCLFLSAASQTTANGFVLFVLLLEEWLMRHPEDRKLIESDPSFMRRAAFESLRMAATVPARLRIATEDVTLSTGRQIKSGERIALLVVPSNTKEAGRFGSDPDQYNPHRKIENDPPWGMTFGNGGHTCPGRPLVTGGRSVKAQVDIDGSMVAIARSFYGAGLALDPADRPQLDPTTHYNNYIRVPVKFSSGKVAMSDA